MRYIRTNGGIIENSRVDLKENGHAVIHDGSMSWEVDSFPIIKQADTIEELCDVIVSIKKHEGRICDFDVVWSWLEWREELGEEIVEGAEIYGAIWTDKGLIYVAKMNEKGELELL